MTSRTNERELDRLRQARADARGRFARQMKLLEQIEATAGDLETVTARWHVQLAALSELAGSAAAAAKLSGLPKSDIQAAARSVDKAAVDAAVQAATPAARQLKATGAPPASSAATDV